MDVGHETITYQFLLKPDYLYELRATAYHESSGEWREWLKIDGQMKTKIKYSAYVPETLKLSIPPAFYRDSVIEVTFNRIQGDFAAVGPIYIYQYECEQTGSKGSSGGIMAKQSHSLNGGSIVFSPNPFTRTLNIKFNTQTEEKFSIKVYDVCGRLVKNIYEGVVKENHILNWDGEDDYDRAIAQGIYILRIENLDTDEIYLKKLVKVH